MCKEDPFEIYRKAIMERRKIYDATMRGEQNWKEIARRGSVELDKLIQEKGRKNNTIPQPKTPMEAPECLYYFEDDKKLIEDDNELKELIDVRKIETFHLLCIDEYTEGQLTFEDFEVAPSWIEDDLYFFQDGTVGSMLPYSRFGDVVPGIYEGQRQRLEKEHKDLYLTLTASFAGRKLLFMPQETENHVFLKSLVDGGNMLTGADFAVIGKDSLHATCLWNGLKETEAKELIAREMGYEVNRLYFVEQPGTYHLDLNMLLLGKGNGDKERIWVNRFYKGIDLSFLYQELEVNGFEILYDDDRIAGMETGQQEKEKKKVADTFWNYNFYNGEFVKGKDKKLYYVTNGISGEQKDVNVQEVQDRFQQQLKVYVPALEKVIFSSTMTEAILNHLHGGVGCRFKGGPLALAEGIL